MDVKQAVAIAKNYVAELYSGEGLVNLGLEEVEFVPEQDIWRVTIGFSRPWETPGGLATALGQLTQRSFKVVKISDQASTVLSLLDRERRN